MKKVENNWRNKTLDYLEKDEWKLLAQSDDRLIDRVMALRKVPLNKFSIEDLRLMIGQEIGLSHLIPLAVEKLKDDLFAEGDFYEGDLLQNVLRVTANFWQDYKNLWVTLNDLLDNNLAEVTERKIDVSEFKFAMLLP